MQVATRTGETRLVGVRFDWGDQEVDQQAREEADAILTRTIYLAMGHTSRQVLDKLGHEVTVEMEATHI